MAQQEPRKVTSIPEGYVKGDIVNGRQTYIKTSSTPPSSSSTNRPVTNKPKAVVKSTATGIRPPRPKQSPPTQTSDIVYMEDVVPDVPVVQKPQSLRTDIKEEFPSGLQKGFHQYSVPDLTGGGNYNKAKSVITDSLGMPHVYDFKQNKYIPTGEPNVRQLMDVQNDTPTIQAPLKTNELPTKFSNDPSLIRVPSYNTPTIKNTNVNPTVPINYEGFNDLGTGTGKSDAQFQEEQSKKLAIPKLKKGGVVNNIKGYVDGGDVYDPINNPISGQGIIQQAGATQFTPTGNAQNAQGNLTSQVNVPAQETTKQNNNAANVKTAGNVLGSVGQAYYSTAQPATQNEATQNAVMQAVGQTGAIGGAISGISAIGNKIGKPIKASSEKLDSEGNLVTSDKSKRNAIVGGIFDPLKALSYRQESGNWGDISGNKYNKFIEDKAKKQIDEVKQANQEAKISGTIANRDAGVLNKTIGDKYDLSKVTFDENGQLVMPQANYKKGGAVGKVKQMCADGGVIKGKGGPKDDKINATVKSGSFIVPAENTKVAETLREKLLMKAPKMKANLNQKGGEKVKLSNKEHLFTPEEKEELQEHGVDMNKLAPNSEHKEEMKEHMMFPKVVGLKDGGPVDWDKYYANKGTKKMTNKTYNELLSPPAGYKGTQSDWKKAVDNAISKGIVTPADKTVSKIKAPSVSKTKVTADVIQPKQVDVITETIKEPEANNLFIKESGVAAPSTSTVSKKGLSSRLNDIDPTAFVGIGQSALGMKAIREAKRPTYEPLLDQSLNEATDKAILDARSGLSPEERFTAEQNIKNAENDARYSARNLSGGNAGTAFNQERMAINSGLANRLNMQIADQQLRREKQQYANQLTANRAAINAQNKQDVFNIANQAFNQRQQSGAELLGAGLANTVGAYRYNRNQKMMNEANQAGNPWMNYNYNPNT